jgi:photosystem II stability/assembly factor-like uncharacterized protein
MLRPLFALLAAVALAPFSGANAPLAWTPVGEPGVGGYLTAVQVSPHNSNHVLLAGDMLGLGYSLDGGATWLPSHAPAYEVADFSFHPANPSVIWAGSMSGPLLSTDGGRTFNLARNGFPPVSGGHYSAPVEVVRFDPANSARLLAFGGSSRRWQSPGKPLWGVVWESRDGGRAWTRLTTLTAAGSDNSADASGLNILSAHFAPSDAKRLYASLEKGGVLASTDGGLTWQPRNTGLPHPNVERLAVHPSDPDTVYVALNNHKPADETAHQPGGIYKSTDGGLTWRNASNGLAQTPGNNSNFASRYSAILLAPTAPDTLLTADTAWNTGVIYASRDAGATWTPVATRGNIGHADAEGITHAVFKPDVGMFAGLSMSMGAFDPNNPAVAFLANMETVLRTTDGGATWQDVSATRVTDSPRPDAWRGTGYTGWCSTDIAFAPDTPGDSSLMAMDAGKIWRSTDDLRSWTYHGHKPWPWGGGHQAVYAGPWIYATAGQHGYDHGIYRLHRATGETFVFEGEKHGLPKMPGPAGLAGIYAHPANPDTVYAAVQGSLLRSDDAGQSWRPVLEKKGLVWIVGDPRSPSTLYASGRDGVWRSEDGTTFKLIGGPRPAGRGRLQVDALGRLYAAHWRASRGGLWRWTPELGWRRLFNENFAINVAIDPADPRRLAVVTNDDPYHDLTSATGVWLSADDGATWRAANTGLPMLRAQAVGFDPHNPGRLLVGTFGRGFFRADWPAGLVPPGEPRRHVHDGDDSAFATPDDDSELIPGLPPLRNTSMTKGGRSAVHWTSLWSGSGKLEAARDDKIFVTPPAALRLSSIGGPANGQVFQQVPATPGQRFTVTGHLRTEGRAKINAAVQFYDRSGQPFQFTQLLYAQDTTLWQPFTQTITVPPRAATIAFVLLLEGDGTAWLDDFAIAP